MKQLLFIISLCIGTALFAGPGLGSLLNGVNDAGTMHSSDGGTGIPVDGGLTLVIGASLLYGAKKIKEITKED